MASNTSATIRSLPQHRRLRPRSATPPQIASREFHHHQPNRRFQWRHYLSQHVIPQLEHHRTSPASLPVGRPKLHRLMSSMCLLNMGRFHRISHPRVLHFSTTYPFSSITSMALQPPDVGRLAETARITLSPGQVDEFAPKIRQVVDWFGQLQDVNLENFEPAIRADSGVNIQPREDLPKSFENREAILAAVPRFDEPYISVPEVLNSE